VIFRTSLLATSLLCAMPALAAIDPPAASKNDAKVRVVTYDPSNPVELHIIPGMSIRIELGADETVPTGGLTVSDQDIIKPDPLNAPPPPTVSQQVLAGGPSGAGQPSCDMNLCRNVVANIVYLKAVRELDAQPLFIQTERINALGVKEQVPYAFEISAKTPEPPPPVATASLDPTFVGPATPAPAAPPVLWAVRFVYPERIKQQAAAEYKKRQDEWVSRNREGAVLKAPIIDTPNKTSNIKYGYRGSAAFAPDVVWDDGRFTYLRYKGNRRVPNVYSLLPNGEPTIPPSTPQPDAEGTTLKVSGTAAKWFISDGSENGKPPIGCLLNAGPDPDGRNSMTVATQ
jgi:type IV secretion system protein VirB9